jgi:hypothetical protein
LDEVGRLSRSSCRGLGCCSVKSCPLLTLSVKLKVTTRRLQGWSERKVGHVASQLELAKELLHQLDIAHDSRGLSVAQSWLRNSLKKHAIALASLSITIARLRSRINWIKDGDANMALFHANARYRKIKNFIATLTSRGCQTLTSHEDKAIELDGFTVGCLAPVSPGRSQLIFRL